MNLKNWIIKKLGGFTENEVRYMVKNIPIHNSNPETFYYGTSYSKLPKDITQEDLNNWYKRKDEKDKED